MQLAEGCRRIEPKIVEDDDKAWDDILVLMDRWGDRRVREADPLDLLFIELSRR